MRNAVLLFALCLTCTAQDPLRNGLIGYYSFDINADDTSGANNHGFATAEADYVPGFFGAAIAFDKPGARVTIPWKDWQGSFSVATWLFLELGTETGMRPLAGPMVIDRGTGLITARISGTPNPVQLTATTAVPPGSWHHVSFVYDHSAKRAFLYIDGRESARVDVPFSTTPTFAAPQVGGDGQAILAGRLDDLMFYQRALTAGEISGLTTRAEITAATLLNCGAAGQVPCPVRSFDDLFHPQWNRIVPTCKPGLATDSSGRCRETGARLLLRPIAPISLDGTLVSPAGYEAIIQNAPQATFQVPQNQWPANCQRLRRYAGEVCANIPQGPLRDEAIAACNTYTQEANRCDDLPPFPRGIPNGRHDCESGSRIADRHGRVQFNPLYTLEEWRNLYPDIQLMVNGNWFDIDFPDGSPHRVPCTLPLGWGVAAGQEISDWRDPDVNTPLQVQEPGQPARTTYDLLDAFVVEQRSSAGGGTTKTLRIVSKDKLPVQNAQYAISGFIIVQDGNIRTTFPPSIKPQPPYARAALGLSQDGQTMYLVVVQPGPKGSPQYDAGGLTTFQLARYFQQKFNAWNVLNLDNGGSSQMIFQHEGTLLKARATDNDPDGRPAYRPLPVFLGLSGLKVDDSVLQNPEWKKRQTGVALPTNVTFIVK